MEVLHFLNYIIIHVFLLLLNSFQSKGQGTTYYVSNSYNSTSCYRRKLCPNIVSALLQINTDKEENAVVYIRPGNYSGVRNTNLCSVSSNYFKTSNCSNLVNVTLSGFGDPSLIHIYSTSHNSTGNRFLSAFKNAFMSVSNLTLFGFNVAATNPVAPNSPTYSQILGGAIFMEGVPSMTLSHMVFRNCTGEDGGAIYAHNTFLSIKHSLFEENLAVYRGGGVFSISSSLYIYDSHFYKNNATSTFSEITSSGGAVYIIGGAHNSTIIERSVFVNNSADHEGGAIDVNPGASNFRFDRLGFFVVRKSNFTDNRVTGSSECFATTSCTTAGGALYIAAANVSIEDSNFLRNTAKTLTTDPAQGGAIFSTNLVGALSTLSLVHTNIIRCDFERNDVQGSGGAIYIDKQIFNITDCSFRKNNAYAEDFLFSNNPPSGGALYIGGSQASMNYIHKCNFSGNSAYSGWGGAIFVTESTTLLISDAELLLNSAVSSYTNAAQGGALMATSYSVITIVRSNFFGNLVVPTFGVNPLTYSGSGGAIFAQSISLSITDCTFQLNLAFTGQFDSGATGGALVLEDCNPADLTSNTFLFNGAIGYLGLSTYASCGSGGAIYIKFSAANIVNCHFRDNIVSAGGNQNSIGGAIAIFFDLQSVEADARVGIQINHTEFHNNSAFGQLCYVAEAGTGGAIGIIGANTPPVQMNYVNFTHNLAVGVPQFQSLLGLSSSGGAIIASLSTALLITNSMFRYNGAIFGTANDIASIAGNTDEYNHLRISRTSFVAYSGGDLSKRAFEFAKYEQTVCAIINEILEQTGNGNFDGKDYKDDLSRLVQLNSEETHYHMHVFDQIVTYERSLLEKDGRVDEALITAELTKHLNRRPSIEQVVGQRLVKSIRRKAHVKHYPTKLDSKHELSERLLRNRRLDNSADDYNTDDFFDKSTALDIVDNIPDILLSMGRTEIRDCSFTGPYKIFSGDYDQYRSSYGVFLKTQTDTNNTGIIKFSGKVDFQDVKITLINANLTVDVDEFDRKPLMFMQLNAFNSSINFRSNLAINETSLLYDSKYIGLSTQLREVGVYFQPNITFYGAVLTGYGLPEILSSGGSVQYKNVIRHENDTLNSTTKVYFDNCRVFIKGNLVLDSPFRTIQTYSSDSSPSTIFSNSFVFLSNNATLTVLPGGNISILTSSSIVADAPNFPALFNYGNISLLGTTVSLIYQTSLNPNKAEQVARSGSLGSILKVVGDFVQGEEGVINVVLNSTFQRQPVVYMPSNKYLSGAINLQFYDAEDFSPNLILYDANQRSNFTIIYFENVSSASLLPSSPLSLSIQAPEGLAFENLIQKRKNSYEEVVSISNIACEDIFTYYSQFNTFSLSAGYPCYICVMMNSSCELCNGNTTCSLKGSCPAGNVLHSDSCCDKCSASQGDCRMSGDTPSSIAFTCECKWFYTGVDCTKISLEGFIVLFVSCTFVVFVASIVYVYRRSQNQKEKVLEELREGILRHTDTANNEYIQNMQQALILNDVFVKFEEIKLESAVGEGSFGVVHKATFRGAQVAVKKMRSLFVELTDKDIEEFRKEAYMMSRLRHPNIVLVMGISLVDQDPLAPPPSKMMKKDDSDLMRSMRVASVDKKKAAPQKTVCIITEFLEQGSLSDILYGPTRLPEAVWTYELILTCALQAARGMLYLHSHQPPICHRDLKSSNLVVDDHWVVKVTDFGMSRIVPEKVLDEEKGIGDDSEPLPAARGDSVSEQSMFSAQSVMDPVSSNALRLSTHPAGNLEMTSNLGTTAWCAPEILTSGSRARYSVKVDVYSFGMVLWELWEKKRPFDEFTSRFDIMDAVRAGKRPAISENCPPTYKAMIKRCWQTEPSRRPTFNYIVRYLKDELARVKRNKSGSGGGISSIRNVGNYLRPSFSAMRSSLSERNSEIFSSIRKSMGNSNSSVNSQQQQQHAGIDMGRINSADKAHEAAATATATANGSVAGAGPSRGSSFSQGQGQQGQQGQGGRSSRSGSATSNPMLASAAADGARDDESRDSFRNLPDSRAPLVKAVDRSLSYLTESPSIASPLSNFHKYGAPGPMGGPGGGANVNKGWRDRYVMKFSGWNSSNPDSGLPPQSRQSYGQYPLSTSPSPVTNFPIQPIPSKNQRKSLPGPAGRGISAPIPTPIQGQSQVYQSPSSSNRRVSASPSELVSGSEGSAGLVADDDNDNNPMFTMDESSSPDRH